MRKEGEAPQNNFHIDLHVNQGHAGASNITRRGCGGQLIHFKKIMFMLWPCDYLMYNQHQYIVLVQLSTIKKKCWWGKLVCPSGLSFRAGGLYIAFSVYVHPFSF